jgi:hypothetical protein
MIPLYIYIVHPFSVLVVRSPDANMGMRLEKLDKEQVCIIIIVTIILTIYTNNAYLFYNIYRCCLVAESRWRNVR